MKPRCYLDMKSLSTSYQPLHLSFPQSLMHVKARGISLRDISSEFFPFMGISAAAAVGVLEVVKLAAPPTLKIKWMAEAASSFSKIC